MESLYYRRDDAFSFSSESRTANSLSLQKYYRPAGRKTSWMAADAKGSKNEVGIADEMIERIR